MRLNQFQRMMLRWNKLHPYNAVHVVRVSAPLDPDALNRTISGAIDALGFGEVFFNNAGNPTESKRWSMRPAQPPPLSILPPNDPSALHSEIERQINTPFLCGPVVRPFRFFAQADGPACWLGMAYFHPVADAESIVWFLKLCVERHGRKDDLKPSLFAPELHPKLSAPSRLGLALPFLRRALAIPATGSAMRQCRRPPIRNHDDYSNRFAFFSLSGDRLRALLAASKSWGVTVNDILLALLMKAVSPLSSRRTASGKRKKIGLGCIVNLRKDLGFSAPAFGLYLGSFVVSADAPESQSLENLSHEIHRQTTRIKKIRLAAGTPVELAFGRCLFSLFSTERQKKLYQKTYPLWGGITNMNLNSIWPQSSGSIDYFRAVSTGPATPLVLSATTIADRLNIGLTFRPAVFSDADIQQIRTELLELLNRI